MIEIEEIYNNPKGKCSNNFRILLDDFGIVILPKQSKDWFVVKRYCTKYFVKKMVFTLWKKWDEFKSRYFKELEKYSESVNKVLAKAAEGS
jgi:uncharacterized protein YeaO (DUF488 family)